MIESLSDRQDYPCLKNFNYLNQASLGLIGNSAVSAMHNFLNETARHGNLKMSDAAEATFLDSIRLKIAHLFQAKFENIAIISSASEILSQLPSLINPEKGKKIILVSSDFPAITRPWIGYSKTNNLELFFVNESVEKTLTQQIIESIDEDAAAVCVSLVQFSSGTCLDVIKLRSATRKFGIKLVIDITQAAGVIPLSLESLKADLVICSGYKWLGGHGGVAFAVFSKELLKKQPLWIGWFGGKNPFDMDATKLSLAETAAKYTQSTLSYISVVGLHAAMDDLLQMSIKNIYSHSHSLATILISKLEGLNWEPFHKTTSSEFSPHIISLCSPELNIQSKILELTENGIICGNRNGRLRISIAHYNNESDILSLLKQL